MQSGYKVTCERDDCFACVNGECVILVENNFGEKKEKHKDCPIVEINGPAFIVDGTAWTQDGIIGAPVLTPTYKEEVKT